MINKSTLVIIPCGQSKIWDQNPDHGPVAAADAYTGAPFAVNRQYATTIADSALILSAKYGFIPFTYEIPGPYNVTFKRKSTQPVTVERLKDQIGSLELHHFERIIGLGGKEYRQAMSAAFQGFNRTVEFPFAGLPIGKCMQAVKKALKENQRRVTQLVPVLPPRFQDRDSKQAADGSVEAICESLHRLLATQSQFGFPFQTHEIPKNGIYVLFEVGEEAHGGQRIVRIGTHTGRDQLRSRLKQHFVQENKDRSIFRKNIGRALLNRAGDPFLVDWNLDLTTRAAKDRYAGQIDKNHQEEIEQQVSEYMQKNFRFVIFPVAESTDRLRLESMLISTVSRCQTCRPSPHWLGLSSPVSKIRNSGLWQVNELDKEPFDNHSLVGFQRKYFQ